MDSLLYQMWNVRVHPFQTHPSYVDDRRQELTNDTRVYPSIENKWESNTFIPVVRLGSPQDGPFQVSFLPPPCVVSGLCFTPVFNGCPTTCIEYVLATGPRPYFRSTSIFLRCTTEFSSTIWTVILVYISKKWRSMVPNGNKGFFFFFSVVYYQFNHIHSKKSFSFRILQIIKMCTYSQKL